MDKVTKIRELIRSICDVDKTAPAFLRMEVVSVEGDLCTAKIHDFEIPNIRLAVLKGGSEEGILITPAKDSIILVADLSGGLLRELAVIGYSEIDSVRIHKGDTTLFMDDKGIEVEVGKSTVSVSDGVVKVAAGKSTVEMNDSLIKLNGDDFGGLVQINKLTEKLNNLVNEVNKLVTQYNSHTHIGNDSMGGAIATTTLTPKAVNASSFTASNYENTKIKQ